MTNLKRSTEAISIHAHAAQLFHRPIICQGLLLRKKLRVGAWLNGVGRLILEHAVTEILQISDLYQCQNRISDKPLRKGH